MDTLSLWDRRGRASIDERYAAWRRTTDGQTVFREVLTRAIRLRARGWTHYSVKALIEAIRYDRDVALGPSADGSGFKINDHYSSRLAREVIASDGSLRGFFETRELRS
jgi:hypothetical protein